MNSRRVVFGAMLMLLGGILIWTAFALKSGDGMFGRLPEKAAFGVTGVMLFIPGAVQLIKGLRRQ